MLRTVVAIAAALAAMDSAAQLSGSVSLTSDYRFRGVSLSNGMPAAQGNVEFDCDGGWYAGALASSVRFDASAGRGTQRLSYAGYARKLAPRLAVDAGATYTSFSGELGYDYGEVHAGFAVGELAGRLYYSPDYFGQGSGSFYAQIDGERRLVANLRLIGRVGLLWLTHAASGGGTDARRQLDGRGGVAADLGRLSVQLVWVATNRISAVYPVDDYRDRSTWLLSASASF